MPPGNLGFHSLREERACDLRVEGEVPGWLSGSLLRNGPGAFEMGEAAVDHWFDGLAMLHRFTFGDDGVAYRNRFLRTDAYAATRAGRFDGGFATGEAGLLARLKRFLLDDPYDNANVIAERIGGEYLALTETPRWVAFDPEMLTTRGHVRYDGDAPTGQLACAHLNRDPDGRAVNFETRFGRTNYYHVYEMTDPRNRTPVASVPVDEPAYMHSFALTPNYVVLTEFPFVVDPLDFFKPGTRGPFVQHYEWTPDRGTRFLVIDRAAGEVVADPLTDAFFGFHHANAYEDGDDLVVDLETVPGAASIETLYIDRLRAGDLDVFGGRLERFRVAPAAGTVDRRTVYEGGTALPTVSPARWCRRHRYVYAQGTEQPVTEWPQRVVKVDVETGRVVEFADGDNHFGEPLFVPRPGGDAEDDGVVLTVMLDVAAEHSWLVVLDGQSFDERARAAVPHAIPFDFHGRFLPELVP
jgi:beta-carotene 15,15'-monooxygenase